MPHPPDTDTTTEIPPLQKIKGRKEELKRDEVKWFINNIKVSNETDEPDANNDAGQGTSNQQSSGRPTDAFGRLYKRKGVQRKHYAWFVRLSVKTGADVLENVLTKLHIKDENCHPLHIHCIDYERDPNEQEPRCDVGVLKSDLESLLRTTVGIVLTWSGLNNSMVHEALAGVSLEGNLLSVATPSWSDVKETMTTRLGGIVLQDEDKVTKAKYVDIDARTTLGDRISQHANNFLLLDHVDAQNVKPENILNQRKKNFRHFHYAMIQAMKSDENELPAVCILFNGHDDALKMVLEALRKKIPVLVVEGSGGYADIIAKIYKRATLEIAKERKQNGKIHTRYRKVPHPRQRKEYLMDNKRLCDICQYLDLITVYEPGSYRLSLDSVIFEALSKREQPEKFKSLVRMMKHVKDDAHRLQAVPTPNTGDTSIELFERQMDSFITALKQKNADMVAVFLEELKLPDMQHFHMGWVLKLYNDQETDEPITMRKIRDDLNELLEELTYFPLRCLGKGCPNCDTTTASERSKHEWTCLHPVQELFLWSLYQESVDLALVFWERCNDKIAAALFAQKIFHLHAKKKQDPDDKWQMNQGADQFQSLAIATLKSCHQMDEIETRSLLTKPCSWWGNVSVLQMAIMMGNRDFMKQTACENVMTRIWKAQPLVDPDPDSKEDEMREIETNPCQFVINGKEDKCCFCCEPCGCLRRNTCFRKLMNTVQSPRFKFGLSFFSKVVFLLLFSGILLFDLHHGLTPYFIILIIWVGAFLLEELRQLCSKDPVVKNNDTARHRSFRAYFRNWWNILDVSTITVFIIGVALNVTADPPNLFFVGQVMLCIDFILFSMRIFQMLMMVNDELGLMVVMVFKMIWDTMRFFVILIVFVISYAVTSESLLYKENEMTWLRLFHVPRKAYWQVFGELSLEEIENRENDSCASGNNSKHYGYDTAQCPTDFGRYAVPFFLAVYILITNVLLLNLLIARFGETYNKVRDEAGTYQSWHRSQITIEYYGRPILPPPLNWICFICEILTPYLSKVHCCSCKNSQNGDDIPLTGISDAERTVKANRAADGKSMDIFWDNSLKPLNGFSYYTVKLYKDDKEVTKEEQEVLTYKIAQKPQTSLSEQAFTAWNLDPSYPYTVEIDSKKVVATDRPDETETLCSEDIRDILDFEDHEMSLVLMQEKADNPVFTELKSVRDATKAEIKKIPEEFTEGMDRLKTDVEDTLTERMKSVKDDTITEIKKIPEKFTEGMDKLKTDVEDTLTKSIGKSTVKASLDTIQENMTKINNCHEQHQKAFQAAQKQQREHFEQWSQQHQQQMEKLTQQKLKELNEQQQQQMEKLIQQKLEKLTEQQQQEMEKLYEQQQQQMGKLREQQQQMEKLNQQQLQLIEQQRQQLYMQQLIQDHLIRQQQEL